LCGRRGRGKVARSAESGFARIKKPARFPVPAPSQSERGSQPVAGGGAVPSAGTSPSAGAAASAGGAIDSGPPQPAVPSTKLIARSPFASMSRTQVVVPDASAALNSQLPGASGSVLFVPLHIGAPFSSVGPVVATSVTIILLLAYLFAWPFSSFGVTRSGMVSHTPPSETDLIVRSACSSGSSSLALPEPPQAASAKAATEAVPRARRPECFRIDIVDVSPGYRSAPGPVKSGADFRSKRR